MVTVHDVIYQKKQGSFYGDELDIYKKDRISTLLKS